MKSGMKRSALVKVRVTPATKSELRTAARRASKTDSGLLRSLIGQAIDGRTADEGVRSDMVGIRVIANALMRWKEQATTGDGDIEVVENLATRLHDLAERRLGLPL